MGKKAHTFNIDSVLHQKIRLLSAYRGNTIGDEIEGALRSHIVTAEREDDVIVQIFRSDSAKHNYKESQNANSN